MFDFVPQASILSTYERRCMHVWLWYASGTTRATKKGNKTKNQQPPKRRKTERPSDHICCRRRPQTTLRFIGSLSKLTSTFVTFVTVFSNLHKHTSTMSGVVGIDFGYQTCLIAAAGRGGVDVVLNGSSNRQNPYVSIYLSIVVLYC